MPRELKETLKAGVWLTANAEGYSGCPDVPDGFFAAIVTTNDEWFAVDVAGNVRGNPEAVEREALALQIDQNLIAAGAVGLARLAMKVKRFSSNS